MDPVILQSHYHAPSAAITAAFPVVLRAGHLRASADYAVVRRISRGHDLLYCLAGAGSVEVHGQVHAVRAGEMAWINGYEPHAHRAEPSDPWELLWMRIEGPGLEALHRLLGADRAPVFQPQDAQSAGVRTCFRQMLRLMGRLAVDREDEMHIVFATLVSRLRRSRQSAAKGEERQVPREMAKVINRMALYPQQAWTAAELARLAGMSVARFYRTFRQITGSAPIDWLRRERILLARRRLLETDAPIKAISEQAGYNSPFFFSRDFKRATGLSPSEFRHHERRPLG